MRLGERILLRLSREPEAGDYMEAPDAWTLDNALDRLIEEFADLGQLVQGKHVVDFGCGNGWQSVALVHAGARAVLGVENNPKLLNHARELARSSGTDDRVRIVPEIPADLRGTFDIVITQNAMEHFADPEGILREMTTALRPGGRVLVTFGPPWFAPSGSHMHFFTRVPWVNLLFAESAVMAVRARYRSDGATRYEEVESGLNRMTVRRFERIIAACGLRVERRRYRCVKGLDFLQWAPGLRELFINNVSSILTSGTEGH